MLNGTKEEVEKLREKMEERRAKAKTKVTFYSASRLAVMYKFDLVSGSGILLCN